MANCNNVIVLYPNRLFKDFFTRNSNPDLVLIEIEFRLKFHMN